MTARYRRVTLAELAQLQASPDSIVDFLYPTEVQTSPDRELDIDRAWHAIHFLLTNSAWDGDYPFVCVVMGGESIGSQDLGYGPARYLLPEQVKDISNALEGMPADKLLERFSFEKMNVAEIYPHG